MLKKIFIVFIIFTITITIILPYFTNLKNNFLTKEERLKKFYPEGLMRGFFPSNESESIDKNTLNYFKKFDNKIYFSFDLPLDGYHIPIPEADTNSFQTLSQYLKWEDRADQDKLRRRNIGLDKNYVYCGFQKIPNLKPSNLIYLGNGYLTDNKNTYFCDWQFKAKSDMLEPNILEKIDYALLGTKIARSGYYYPLIQLSNGIKSYKLIFPNTITNGQNTYVDGRLLKISYPYQLEYLSIFKPDDKIWQTESYTTDKENVYFKNEMLDLKYHPKLKSIPFDFEIYLFDPNTKTYFYKYHKIDYKNLKMIKSEDNQSFNPIFTYGEYLSFFNTKTLQLEEISENPFTQHFYPLSQSVLSNDQNIYFFRKYNRFSSTIIMFFSELCSTTSEIRVLNDMPLFKWKKISDLKIKHPEYKSMSFQGAFWEYNGDFYYLPEIGSYQYSLLKVSRTADVNKLIYNKLNYVDAEKLLTNTEIFKPVTGKKFAKIQNTNRFCFKNYFP